MAFYRYHRKAERSTAQHAPQAAQNAKKNGIEKIHHAKLEMTHIAMLSLDYGQAFIQRGHTALRQYYFTHVVGMGSFGSNCLTLLDLPCGCELFGLVYWFIGRRQRVSDDVDLKCERPLTS
ncbi:MAG: hypothetical protein E6J74_21255 [Deltaproteobacteria bacterium]|nr:MAG: hypothetical protein E6J74_21255 [Deltaproteobacteria bacterium]